MVAMYNNGLRPVKSESRPYRGIKLVEASKYADPTQEYCPASPSNRSEMIGSAVETIVWSRAARPTIKQMPGITIFMLL